MAYVHSLCENSSSSYAIFPCSVSNKNLVVSYLVTLCITVPGAHLSFYRMANNDDFSQLVDNDELSSELHGHTDSLEEDRKEDVSYVNEALDDRNESQDTAESREHESRNGSGYRNDTNKNNGSTTNGHAVSESNVSVRVPQDNLSAPPVYYSNRTGETTVVNEPVVIRRADGTTEIQTQQCCVLAPHRHIQPKPLRMRKIKLLQAFSIVAVFVFFPLGIPAMYFAFKTEKKFNEGITQGNIEYATKLARRTERLIIFSIMGALLVAVSVFAIIERHLMADDEQYWESKSRGAVMPV